MRMSPREGVRKPAMMLSIVDLPQPLGPTRQRNSDGLMEKLTSSSAFTAPAGVS
jgi:hypothetical protein